MSAFEVFGTNDDLEKEGVWQNFGTFRVRLARAGGANKRFARLIEAKTKPFLRAIKTDTLDMDTQLRITREVFAETVVTGWQCNKGTDKEPKWEDVVEVAPGQFEAFSPASVLKALVALPNLFTDIQQQANSFANYRDEVRAVNAGN